MMSGIRGANTKPELIIRRGLHRLGLRYRLHSKLVPGRPDLVFPAFKAAVFVHGCFWHGHDCRFFKMPQTRTEFWSAKISANRNRDAIVREQLKDAGWRQLTIWECAIRGKDTHGVEAIIAQIERWIRSQERCLEIRGG
jgi:DNA mismatch endonuclease (patch repair protein)